MTSTKQISVRLKQLQPYLLLLLITCIAYWPIAIHLFSLKNDALVYFLPYRFQLSETIQSGSFPWWNPYLYTGLPIHSDMQSGVWNPVVMLVSVFTSYNMSVLQWELLFYLFVAAAGMYKFSREVGISVKTGMLAGVAYACSGFMTDSGSFIPWIASAAYLPFVFIYFFRLLHAPSVRSSLLLAIAGVLLLTAGYPSFFIFTGYILIVGLIAWIIYRYRSTQLLNLSAYLGLSLVVFLLISSPALLSWWDYLGYYSRGTGVDPRLASTNYFPFFSSISWVVNSAVSKPHELLATDISARNASTGIFLFILFIGSLLFKKDYLIKFLLGIAITAFLFSLGNQTPVHGLLRKILPFMDSFRHPSTMRIFSTLGIIVCGAIMLDKLFWDTSRYRKKILYVIIATAILLLVLLLVYFPLSNIMVKAADGFDKSFLDKLAFPDLLVGIAGAQLIFLLAFLLLIWRGKLKYIIPLAIFNSIFFCWIALPFTLISQARTATINNVIAVHPRGFPIPSLDDPIRAAILDSSAGELVYAPFYNKKILIQDRVVTPTLSVQYNEFLKDLSLRKAVHDYPPVYFADTSIFKHRDSFPGYPADKRIVLFQNLQPINALQAGNGGTVRLTKFAANRISMEVTTERPGILNVFQTYHHNCKATVDGNMGKIIKSNRAFMSLIVPEGRHAIELRYKPGQAIVVSLFIALGLLLLLLIYFIFRAVKTMIKHD